MQQMFISHSWYVGGRGLLHRAAQGSTTNGGFTLSVPGGKRESQTVSCHMKTKGLKQKDKEIEACGRSASSDSLWQGH